MKSLHFPPIHSIDKAQTRMAPTQITHTIKHSHPKILHTMASTLKRHVTMIGWRSVLIDVVDELLGVQGKEDPIIRNVHSDTNHVTICNHGRVTAFSIDSQWVQSIRRGIPILSDILAQESCNLHASR